MKKLTVQFDGGCRTSHGIAAGAAVVLDEEGNELGTDAHLLRQTTTPVAEYTGLIVGLQLAERLGATHVLALGDAELIVRHVNGVYQCHKPHLRSMLDLVHLLMARFEECEVREFPKAGPKHKRRFGNARADQLANECMDAA